MSASSSHKSSMRAIKQFTHVGKLLENTLKKQNNVTLAELTEQMQALQPALERMADIAVAHTERTITVDADSHTA